MEIGLRVLLLADGRSAHTVRYQKELTKQGVDVTLASLEYSDTVDIRLKKKSVSNSLSYFFSNREIKNLVGKLAPDVVNAHFASAYGFSAAVSRVWKKTPVALHCLGSDILISPGKSLAHKRRVMYSLARASHIFVDSQYLAGKVQELYPTRDIDVIPWGVESEMLDLYEKRINQNILTQRPLRVLVPRPHNPVYNDEFIVRALKELVNRKQVSLSFPDWGDDRDRFKRIAKEECPEGIIDYYRFMPRGDYIEFLSGFDVYLSASLLDSSPASLIDAMAAGLFPVVADIPGVREWMDPDSGILFEQNNPASLQKSFVRLLSRDVNTVEILAANHAKVRKNGLFSQNIKKTIGIMAGLCNRGN